MLGVTRATSAGKFRAIRLSRPRHSLRHSPTTEASRSIRFRWIGAAVLMVLTLGMFGDVLLTSRPTVLSDGRNDLASQFIYWRAFAAEQLRQGRLPLWNPHVFSGTPFLGWGQ